MTKFRIHYASAFATRCGMTNPKNWTTDPQKVTCKTCLKLLKGEVK